MYYLRDQTGNSNKPFSEASPVMEFDTKRRVNFDSLSRPTNGVKPRMRPSFPSHLTSSLGSWNPEEVTRRECVVGRESELRRVTFDPLSRPTNGVKARERPSHPLAC